MEVEEGIEEINGYGKITENKIKDYSIHRHACVCNVCTHVLHVRMSVGKKLCSGACSPQRSNRSCLSQLCKMKNRCHQINLGLCPGEDVKGPAQAKTAGPVTASDAEKYANGQGYSSASIPASTAWRKGSSNKFQERKNRLSGFHLCARTIRALMK